MISKAKFGSLLFREFRLTKKNMILLAGMMLALTALIWFSLFSADSLTDNINADSLVAIMALISMFSLFIDDIHYSDVASGWITYSYALPVTPLERAAVRFVRRLTVCAGSCLFSLANASAVCAYLGKALGAVHILWYILIFSAALLTGMADTFFMLRSRNSGDIKKMRTASGMASLGIMIVLILVVYNFGLHKFLDDEAAVSLPGFTPRSFLWAVPLLLLLMAADFCISYHSLRRAYPNAAKRKTRSERGSAAGARALLPEKYNGITGMLYMELAQNRLVFILMAAVPVLLTALPFCFTAAGVITGSQTVGHMFEIATNVFVRGFMSVLGIFIVSGMMSEIFRGDDKKIRAYFVISSPVGVKGFMYNKYAVTLMMNLIYMISGIFADSLLATVNYFVTGNALKSDMASFYLMGVFLLMMISALDIPFTVRYGSKRGSLVKMTVMLSLCTAATAVFSSLPEGVRENLMDTASSVLDGSANGIRMLALSVFSCIAFGAFLYSYKVSCRLFMKGADEYDK